MGSSLAARMAGKIPKKSPTPVATHSEHARELLIAKADQIRVFRMELVHQALSRRRLVLGNLLNKSLIIEAEDLFKLPLLRGDFEPQRSFRIHAWLLGHRSFAALHLAVGHGLAYFFTDIFPVSNQNQYGERRHAKHAGQWKSQEEQRQWRNRKGQQTGQIVHIEPLTP